MSDSESEIYADRVTALVQSFVRMWIKFEAMSHDEIAKAGNRFNGMSSAGEPRAASNQELFYRVSNCIYHDESLTMGELGSALSVPLSTATRIVDWLVADGYVRRIADPGDRRVVRVSLTNAGKELHEAIENYTGKRVQHMLSCLTSEEQATLFALFHKVEAAMEKVVE
ncbi:MAG: MarR family transcriptional regulator [Dehalococcoidia bacterium]|nr:MarR family transcriptional regulator [Dehalococcoidia bacterium]